MLEIKKMWQKVRADTAWGGAPSVRRLFGDERTVKAILEFLAETEVGKMPSRVLLAGGLNLEEEELEGFSLQVLGEKEYETGVSSSCSGPVADPGHPRLATAGHPRMGWPSPLKPKLSA